MHICGRRILELLNGRTEEIGIEKGGRPFFTRRHADFSISHSRSMAALAYWAEKKPETGLPFRTGCDIQHVKPIKNFGEIARRYFSPEEQHYIAAASGEPEQLGRFYQLWVLKECFLKAQGLSVFDMPDAPSFAGPDGLARETNLPLHFFLYELGDEAGENNTERYLLAAARENDGAYCPPPEFRWFSEPMPLRSITAIKAVVNPVNTVSPNI
ncbi:hypothetical protein AGMMS4952_11190 [Spirochaetia bacterium]|nr:hypothetical protein AGMMS4952_11190 [Spirochaetia bacterium]